MFSIRFAKRERVKGLLPRHDGSTTLHNAEVHPVWEKLNVSSC